MATADVTPPRSLARWLPGLRLARGYRPSWLRHDLVAGLVLTALLVPAGMGYAEASGLPAIYGLYATIVPLLAYAVFGPSRILVLGPDSSLAPLIFATIVPLANGDEDRLVALAGMLALLSGALCIVAGLAKFGFLADLLSKPVRYGYLNGIALTVLVSQLPKLCGFSVDAEGVIAGLREFAEGVAGGEVNTDALVIGLGCLAVIICCKRYVPKVPGTLLAVIGAIVAVAARGLTDADLPLVGDLPQGLPSFAWPSVGLDDLGPLLAGAIGIAFVSFADTSVLSRTYAIRTRTEVDPNQELFALGMANVSAGLFSGFSISSSSSRTPVAESAGSKSQMTGVVGALAIVVLLVAFPSAFANLPSSALAAVVIVAASSLVEIKGVRRLWKVRKAEFFVAMTTFLGVAVFGVIPGIGIAVALALLQFVQRAWRPHATDLVRVDGMKGYHDADRHPEGRRIPGLVLFRFDAPLFFANADLFEDRVRNEVAVSDPPARWVVVTAEPITDIDATAADILVSLHADLKAEGVVLAFAELKGVVREQLDRYGLVQAIGPDRFYRTIGEAVRGYRAETGTPWVDWEDRLEADGLEGERSADTARPADPPAPDAR
jgi:high affinity sulfate transporter 1